MWQWPTMTWTATVCHQVIGPPLFLDSKWLSSLYVGVFKVGLLTSGKHVPCKRVGLVLALYPACCSNVLRLQLGYCPDVSPGVVCSCPEISAKWSRRRNLRWASIQVGQTPLQIAASRIRLKVNQRSSRQWRSVHLFRTDLWRIIPRLWEDRFISCQLSNTRSEIISREVVPSTRYITASEKQALMLLLSLCQSRYPLLQEAVGVALRIIEVCEMREILGKVARWLMV